MLSLSSRYYHLCLEKTWKHREVSDFWRSHNQQVIAPDLKTSSSESKAWKSDRNHLAHMISIVPALRFPIRICGAPLFLARAFGQACWLLTGFTFFFLTHISVPERSTRHRSLPLAGWLLLSLGHTLCGAHIAPQALKDAVERCLPGCTGGSYNTETTCHHYLVSPQSN